MYLSELIIIISLIYILFYLLIIVKISSDKNGSNALPDGTLKNLPEFSIIVAAKDEAKNIENLITGLSKINYPIDIYEVIIVNDNSKDETLQRAKEFAKKLDNFKIVTAVDKIYPGKRGALDYGISLSRYSNIIITDADCKPENNWLLHHSKKNSTGCDFVFGVAPFYQKNSCVNKISCYENFRNTLLSISAANLGFPYTASARNFSFRKDAFKKIGGYENTTDTISGDDDLLLREAVKNNFKICVLTTAGSFVYSEAKKTFKEYFSQRARHTQSSLHYSIKQKLFLAVWHLLNIVFVFSPLLIPISLYFVLPISIKIIFDSTTAVINQRKFGYRFSIFEVIYLQLVYEIFLIVHFITAKFGKIKWK